MGYLADCYVIKETRSKEEAIKFLDKFLPTREESQQVYELPKFGPTTEMEFESVDDLMDHLEQHPSTPYSIYWRNLDNKSLNRNGMLFYTKDGHLIFGISTDSAYNNEDECLNGLKQYFQTDLGYITYESTPAESFEEFQKIVKGLG